MELTNKMVNDEIVAEVKKLPLSTTPGRLANAIHRAVKRMAKKSGQDPKIETQLWTPRELRDRKAPHGKCYVVNWEAGPYEWAIYASMGELNEEARKRFPDMVIEPYYSFDLCIPVG